MKGKRIGVRKSWMEKRRQIKIRTILDFINSYRVIINIYISPQFLDLVPFKRRELRLFCITAKGPCEIEDR